MQEYAQTQGAWLHVSVDAWMHGCFDLWIETHGCMDGVIGPSMVVGMMDGLRNGSLDGWKMDASQLESLLL